MVGVLGEDPGLRATVTMAVVRVLVGCVVWPQDDGGVMRGLFPAGISIAYWLGIVEEVVCKCGWRRPVQGLQLLG